LLFFSKSHPAREGDIRPAVPHAVNTLPKTIEERWLPTMCRTSVGYIAITAHIMTLLKLIVLLTD